MFLKRKGVMFLPLILVVAFFSYSFVFVFFSYLQEDCVNEKYKEYMSKPLTAKAEYIDLKGFSKVKDGSKKISEIVNRYMEAGYQVTIKGDSMFVEKINR